MFENLKPALIHVLNLIDISFKDHESMKKAIVESYETYFIPNVNDPIVTKKGGKSIVKYKVTDYRALQDKTIANGQVIVYLYVG